MIVIALAPFIIFNIVFILSIIFTHGLLCILLIILFSMHVSGCMGDLYVSLLLIFNKGDLLINDTGPVQTIYRRNNNV